MFRDLLGCGGLRNQPFDLYGAFWRTHPQPNRSRNSAPMGFIFSNAIAGERRRAMQALLEKLS